MMALLPRSGTSPIFDRRVRITVDGQAVEALRVGFTVEKDLTPKPNTAEIVIYNLSASSRARLHTHRAVPVKVEAGYAATGLIQLFFGEMREAFSRPEADGTWATVLRAGDGDGALRGARASTGLRPGVSIERIMSEQFAELGVGLGNAWTELKRQIGAGDLDQEALARAISRGFSGAGSVGEKLDKLMDGTGLEYSIQDRELQVLPKGKVLSTRATVLSPETGLEGTPEVDAQGTMHCRARLIPGLSPGYPLQVARYSRDTLNFFEGTGTNPLDTDVVSRIEKTRYVGDLYGQDFNAELDCRDVKLGPKAKKKAKRQ